MIKSSCSSCSQPPTSVWHRCPGCRCTWAHPELLTWRRGPDVGALPPPPAPAVRSRCFPPRPQGLTTPPRPPPGPAPSAVNLPRRPNRLPRHIEAGDQSGRGCDFHGSRSRAAEGRRRRRRRRSRSRSRSPSRSRPTAMVPAGSRGGGGAAVLLLRGSSPALAATAAARGRWQRR